MINPNGLKTHFISSQLLIMQRMIAKQIFNFVYRIKDIQNTNVSANNL